MTVKEYNHEFLPNVMQAELLIKNIDKAISHMNFGDKEKDEVRRILKIYGLDDEVKNIILTALEYYRVHEGINKLDTHIKNYDKGLLSEDDIETFNVYLEDNDLPTAFGNSDFVRIYKRIVGDSKCNDKIRSWIERNNF